MLPVRSVILNMPNGLSKCIDASRRFNIVEEEVTVEQFNEEGESYGFLCAWTNGKPVVTVSILAKKRTGKLLKEGKCQRYLKNIRLQSFSIRKSMDERNKTTRNTG